MNADSKIINRCVTLAVKGYPYVKSNPPVGAVLIDNGIVVSTGYHGEQGDDHAEVVALSKYSKKLSHAVLYVSLEPCNHHGKTPPCVNAIIESGVKTVVYAESDPHVLAAGGASALSNAGIEVRQVKTDLSSQILKPWRDQILHKKKTVDVYVMLSLNGYQINASEDVETMPYSLFLEKLVQRVNSTEVKHKENEYHSAILANKENLACVETAGKEHNVFLNVLRIPYFVSKESKCNISSFTLLKNKSLHLKLMNMRRYKNSIFETYQCEDLSV